MNIRYLVGILFVSVLFSNVFAMRKKRVFYTEQEKTRAVELYEEFSGEQVKANTRIKGPCLEQVKEALERGSEGEKVFSVATMKRWFRSYKQELSGFQKVKRTSYSESEKQRAIEVYEREFGVITGLARFPEENIARVSSILSEIYDGKEFTNGSLRQWLQNHSKKQCGYRRKRGFFKIRKKVKEEAISLYEEKFGAITAQTIFEKAQKEEVFSILQEKYLNIPFNMRTLEIWFEMTRGSKPGYRKRKRKRFSFEEKKRVINIYEEEYGRITEKTVFSNEQIKFVVRKLNERGERQYVFSSVEKWLIWHRKRRECLKPRKEFFDDAWLDLSDEEIVFPEKFSLDFPLEDILF